MSAANNTNEKEISLPNGRNSGSLPKLFAAGRRARLAFLVVNGIFQAALAVASALLIKQAFDQFIATPAQPGESNIWVFAGALAVIIALTALLRWRGHIDAEVLGQSYVHAVRMRLFQHVARIGADGARQMSKGALMLRFVGDLSALRQWVSLGVARLLVSGLAVALAISALFLLEPVIAFSVSVAVVVTGISALLIGLPLRNATYEARRRRGKMAAILNDRVSRIGVVETFGQEKRERRRFKKLSRNVRDALIDRARFVALLRALSEAGAGIASVSALIVGAFLAIQGVATPGAVVSAMVIAGLLAPKIQDLGRVYEYWIGAGVARQKQEELLQLQPTSRPSGSSRRRRSLADGPGEVRFRKVALEGRLSSISLRIASGSRTVVIGPNGSGKSTFLRLAAGLLQPTSGKVLLDGQNLARCNWEEVRHAFSMVSPDLPLLRGSLRLNLTYGAGETTPSHIVELITICGLDELVARLPGGLNARLSENGEGLSTGERSRIALARALMIKARVLLLDEAEANLDDIAQDALNQIFNTYPGTVIAATHDLSLARSADQVIFMRNGAIEKMCSPSDILAPVDTESFSL